MNPEAIESEIGFSHHTGSSVTFSVTGSNFTSSLQIKKHTIGYAAIKNGGDFEARRTENVSTSHYFVRANNREFNFSNNPTFVSGSDNAFAVSSFKRDLKSLYYNNWIINNKKTEMLEVKHHNRLQNRLIKKY